MWFQIQLLTLSWFYSTIEGRVKRKYKNEYLSWHVTWLTLMRPFCSKCWNSLCEIFLYNKPSLSKVFSQRLSWAHFVDTLPGKEWESKVWRSTATEILCTVDLQCLFFHIWFNKGQYRGQIQTEPNTLSKLKLKLISNEKI